MTLASATASAVPREEFAFAADEANIRESPITADRQSATKVSGWSFEYQGDLVSGWILEERLTLTVERNIDGLYIVSDDLFFVYGLGETLSDAFQDYKVALVEFYKLTKRLASSNELEKPLLDLLDSCMYMRRVSGTGNGS